MNDQKKPDETPAPQPEPARTPETATERPSATAEYGNDASGSGSAPAAETAKSETAPAAEVEVAVSGAHTSKGKFSVGTTVGDALRAMGISAPSSFNLRNAAGRALALKDAIVEAMTITTVAKASGG